MRAVILLRTFSILCSLIFLLFGMIWTYLIALFFMLFGIIGYILLRRSDQLELVQSEPRSNSQKTLRKIALYLNISSFIISGIALIVTLVFN